MPISIEKAQREYINSGRYEGSNLSDFIEMGVTKNVFEQYGEEFLKVLGDVANRLGVVASGKLLSETTYRIVDNGTKMEILFPSYYDFPNQGVKGVKSSKNAPLSPYKFKNYGMNEEGRRSIAKYIEDGHAKIATVVKTKDKALGIGREKKHLSLLDKKVNELIYLIKRFGIKRTGYLDETIGIVFKDFEATMTEAVGRDIILTIEKTK